MKSITIIGIGKLGLGFALILEKHYNVLGIDINQDYVNNLNNKTYTTNEPEYTELLNKSTNFRASTDLKEGLEHSDIVFIIVQTPNSGNDKFYDHSILSNLLVKINSFQPKNKNIIIGCTIIPTYIDNIGKQLLNNCYNCDLSYNPEFVAQGDIINGFRNPDIILIGSLKQELLDILKDIYNNICISIPKYCFMKPLEAEIVKISLNGYITTKISFANMISDLCDNLNVDKDIVLNAIGSDSRIGTKYFKSGYSFGGPCFPRDTKALKQITDKYGIESDLLQGTINYNRFHYKYQAEQLLKQNKDSYIFTNVCYKEGSKIPIIEESAKLKIAEYLANKNKKVIIKDIDDIIIEVKKEYGNLFSYEII